MYLERMGFLAGCGWGPASALLPLAMISLYYEADQNDYDFSFVWVVSCV